MKAKLLVKFVLSVLLLPVFVAAAYPPWILPNTAGGVGPGTSIRIMNLILGIIWPAFVGFSIIMVIVAGYKFMTNKPEEGRKSLIWAVIGTAVGILAWSLPAILRSWGIG